MKQKLLQIFLSILFIGATATGFAQTRDGEFLFSAGVGAAFHTPVRPDFDLTGEYFWNDKISLGLDFDVIFRPSTAFNFIPFGRYHFELDKWPRFSPYVGAGLGALFNSKGQGWLDLMLPELGLSYELSPHFYIGPNTSFHILGGSNTTWDLQMLAQAAYRF